MGRQTLAALRVGAADSRAFSQPGAGPARRERMARLTDEWLRPVYDEAVGHGPTRGLALVAVGSHGRHQAGPLSDLDLVLLHDGSRDEADLAQLADRIWYPVWDGGMKLDHSVRTVAECRQVAATDLPATLGLLDVRIIAGDPDLAMLARAVVAQDWRATARRRLPDLLAAITQRHQRHGELAHLLEPDLKEARGGLRDMTLLTALTGAWLADRPHGGVDQAHERLLDIRDAVHVVTGRGRNRLQAQDQDAVAALLGLDHRDALLRELAEAARVVAAAVDTTVRRASQTQRARTLRVGARRPTLRPLGYGLYAHDGEAVLGTTRTLTDSPLTSLRAAAVAATAGLPLSPATLDNLARHVPPLPQPWPASARELFSQLLGAGEGLIAVWESLTLAGIVETWIPEWAKVRSYPQRNAVHRHTVDRHQVQAVVEAVALVPQVSRPDLLLLACLLHDIGKAGSAGVDHSRAGAPIARAIATRMGYPPADLDVLEMLVAEHLTLVELATRRDPDDPATLALLHQAVGGRSDQLDLLRALTEADARSVGPAAWSDWRARLVGDLTEAARSRWGPLALALDGALDAPTEVSEQVRAAVERDGVHLALDTTPEGQVVVMTAPDRLGLFADLAGILAARGMTVHRAEATTVDGLAIDRWHVDSPSGKRLDTHSLQRAVRRVNAGDRAIFDGLTTRAMARPDDRPTRALVLPEASADATVIELRAADRPGLLYDVGRRLAQLEVSIRSAHIATYAGRAVDTFYLTEADGSVLPPARVAATIGALIDVSDTTR